MVAGYTIHVGRGVIGSVEVMVVVHGVDRTFDVGGMVDTGGVVDARGVVDAGGVFDVRDTIDSGALATRFGVGIFCGPCSAEVLSMVVDGFNSPDGEVTRIVLEPVGTGIGLFGLCTQGQKGGRSDAARSQDPTAPVIIGIEGRLVGAPAKEVIFADAVSEVKEAVATRVSFRSSMGRQGR